MGGFNAPTPVTKIMILSPGSAGLASVIGLKSAWGEDTWSDSRFLYREDAGTTCLDGDNHSVRQLAVVVHHNRR